MTTREPKMMSIPRWPGIRKVIMKQKFEYTKAVEELEAIAAKVENPETGIDDIDKYMKRSQELIAACRDYLRGAREKLDSLEEK